MDDFALANAVFQNLGTVDAVWNQFSLPEEGTCSWAGEAYLDVFCIQVAFHLLFPLWWRGRFVGWRQVNAAEKEVVAD